MYHVCWRQLKRACVINELIQLHIANLIFSINITDKNTGKHIIIHVLVYQNELLLMKITLIYRLAVVCNVFNSVLNFLEISLLHMFQKFKFLPFDILNVLVFIYFLKISLHVLQKF